MGIAYLRRVADRVVHGLLADPSRVRNVLFPSSSETMIDDEVLIAVESWQALGLDWLATGGTPLGTEAIGTGPARGFTSAEVRRVAAKLVLHAAQDIPQSAREDFDSVRDFVMTTAHAEAAMIVFID